MATSTSNKKSKVNCYIDGFNLYHAIVDIAKRTPHSNHLKWLNLKELMNCFVGDDEEIQDIYYFSAYAKHFFDAYKRHERYVKILEDIGIKVIMGNFKKKFPKCKKCLQQYTTHEEKESDINIAIEMLQGAFENKFDKAFLVTSDSDLVSTIKKIKLLFPEKEVILITPPNRSKFASELKRTAKRWHEIQQSQLEKCTLPNKVTLTNGTIITMPKEYK
jgi:uncharacterized LabA/DUF88 family protein